ncbi:MAG TPA: hypothetical protein VD913_05635, partial [bacterium]|nr:hypothetical protein [bacterium]
YDRVGANLGVSYTAAKLRVKRARGQIRARYGLPPVLRSEAQKATVSDTAGSDTSVVRSEIRMPDKAELAKMLQESGLVRFNQLIKAIDREEDVLSLLSSLTQISEESLRQLKDGKPAVIDPASANEITHIMNGRYQLFVEEYGRNYILLLHRLYDISALRQPLDVSAGVLEDVYQILSLQKKIERDEIRFLYLFWQLMNPREELREKAREHVFLAWDYRERLALLIQGGNFLSRYHDFIRKSIRDGSIDSAELSVHAHTLATLHALAVMLDYGGLSSEQIREYKIDLLSGNPALEEIASGFFFTYVEKGVTDAPEMIRKFMRLLKDPAKSKFHHDIHAALAGNVPLLSPEDYEAFRYEKNAARFWQLRRLDERHTLVQPLLIRHLKIKPEFIERMPYSYQFYELADFLKPFDRDLSKKSAKEIPSEELLSVVQLTEQVSEQPMDHRQAAQAILDIIEDLRRSVPRGTADRTGPGDSPEQPQRAEIRQVSRMFDPPEASASGRLELRTDSFAALTGLDSRSQIETLANQVKIMPAVHIRSELRKQGARQINLYKKDLERAVVEISKGLLRLSPDVMAAEAPALVRNEMKGIEIQPEKVEGFVNRLQGIASGLKGEDLSLTDLSQAKNVNFHSLVIKIFSLSENKLNGIVPVLNYAIKSQAFQAWYRTAFNADVPGLDMDFVKTPESDQLALSAGLSADRDELKRALAQLAPEYKKISVILNPDGSNVKELIELGAAPLMTKGGSADLSQMGNSWFAFVDSQVRRVNFPNDANGIALRTNPLVVAASKLGFLEYIRMSKYLLHSPFVTLLKRVSDDGITYEMDLPSLNRVSTVLNHLVNLPEVRRAIESAA